MLRGKVLVTVGLLALLTPSLAAAFPYVARRGESLAQLAERFYGRVELEKVLVAANRLDGDAPLSVEPGMRLEIPSVGHHTIVTGDSWESLADAYLGDRRRAEALSMSNDSMPWLPPVPGREIVVPYPLRYVVRPADSTPSIAYRFLGQRDDAYVVDRFNDLRGRPLEPGELILVPIVDLALTDQGREVAKHGGLLIASEGAGDDRDAQERAERELPELGREVRTGQYLDAVVRGSVLLGAGTLTDPQLGRTHRLLLEAYVALGHDALARKACEEWRRAEPDSPLDPVELSPKILRACISAAAMRSVGPTTVDDLAISASASVPSARPVRSAKPPPTESP